MRDREESVARRCAYLPLPPAEISDRPGEEGATGKVQHIGKSRGSSIAFSCKERELVGLEVQRQRQVLERKFLP